MTIDVKRRLNASDPVYICHGAEGEQCHVVNIKARDDSPWGNQQFTCREIVGGPSSPIRVVPDLGEFQNLSPTGVELKLHCPADGEDCDMELRLHSEFTAEPYPIALKLGHYRCDFKSERAPIRAPVIGQTVTAAVTIESFYKKAVVKNVDVEWRIGTKVVTVPTSPTGESEFTDIVTEEGPQTITAGLYNRYNGETITKKFSFTGYSSSPWEQARLFINGEEVKYGGAVGLIRGKVNEVLVEAPPEIAQRLTLELADAGGLTLKASPDFGTAVNPVGGKFTWHITPNISLSGHVTLVLYSHEVALPWELLCWVISDDLTDEVQEVLVNGVASPPAELLFFRDEPQAVVLTYKPGSPLNGFPLQFVGTTLTGVQPADVVVTPAGESPDHAWTVNVHNNSGTIQLELKGPAGTRGITLPVCKVMSRSLDAEVDKVLVDNVPYPADAVYFRGTPKSITLTYKLHSPLRGYLLELNAIPITGLQPGDLDVTPVTTDPHSWTVEASNRSGTFRLELTGAEFTRGISLHDSKVLSTSLADEADVRIDGLPVPANGNVFFREQAQTVELVPKPGSPLAGWRVKLDCTIKSGLDPADMISQPAFGSERTTHSWVVTGANNSGTFELSFTAQSLATGISVPLSKLLSGNPADEFDAKIDGAAIPIGGVEFTGGTVKTLTLAPKPGSPAADHPMILQFMSGSDLVKGDITTTPAFDVKTTTHSWLIQPALKNGSFIVGLLGEGMTTPWALPAFKVKSGSLDEFKAAFDGREVPFSSTLLVSRGVGYLFELVLPKSSLLIGKKVLTSWGAAGDGLGVAVVPAIGTQVTLEERTKWAITGGDIKNGLFSIKFAVEDFNQHLEVKFNLANHQIKVASISTESDLVVGGDIIFEVRIVYASDPGAPVKDASVTVRVLNIPFTYKTNDKGVALVPFKTLVALTYTLEFNVVHRPNVTPVVASHTFDVKSSPENAVFRKNTSIELSLPRIGYFKLFHLGLYYWPSSSEGLLYIHCPSQSPVLGKAVGLRYSPAIPAIEFKPGSGVLRDIASPLGLRWDVRRTGNQAFIVSIYSPDYPDSYVITFFTEADEQYLGQGVVMEGGLIDLTHVSYFQELAKQINRPSVDE